MPMYFQATIAECPIVLGDRGAEFRMYRVSPDFAFNPRAMAMIIAHLLGSAACRAQNHRFHQSLFERPRHLGLARISPADFARWPVASCSCSSRDNRRMGDLILGPSQGFIRFPRIARERGAARAICGRCVLLPGGPPYRVVGGGARRPGWRLCSPSPSVRMVCSAVCRACVWLGLELDESSNHEHRERTSTRASRVAAFVIKADENLMIARHNRVPIGS
jgi:hypothetical protein